ncbi:uncharacterized protein E0L32_006557 [Thyridium curvatum]|uniref:Squalene monooxygenase n=1 Tax=Thyridium curvatum TaxID=1093900 RepID=A0A507B7T1_9PEZI|nr:uncharacterized protein E0L32_006557 [Thyridium curvatum]TPX13131.1 hypothetical protein E0L32_006557 [Thyridium curvatum]
MTTNAEFAESQRERREKFHEADVVVVGAGVFGCAAAYALANQGRSVLLLERSMSEPDRIVGELLQPGGVRSLRKLGLERCTEGIDAIPCYGYHVLNFDQEVVIPYSYVDEDGRVHAQSHKMTDGPNGHHAAVANGSAKKADLKRPEGRSFHHGRFIMKLREACLAHPNITVVETEVTATITGDAGPAVLGVESLTTVDRETREKRPDYFFGQLTIIADGYASKFRKQYVGRAPVVRSKFYALELIDCPLAPAGYGHVVIGKAAPILIYQIGARETRALIAVPNDLPAASPAAGGVRGYIRNVVLPNLPPAVRPCFEAALADGRIPRSMPNSWLPPARDAIGSHPGVVVLGDAYNMRHPLGGGGMTVAFNDVLLVAELLDPARVPDLGDADAVRAALRPFHWRRKSLSSIINVLAQALYSLFEAQDRQLMALRRGCFRYFQLGVTDEPVAMLGGLVHQPLMLARHFFTVAFLAVWVNAVDVVCGGNVVLGLLRSPLVLVDAVLILWKACVVFLPVLYRELL